MSFGTSAQTRAVDCAAYSGSISATWTSRTRSADEDSRCSPVSASRTWTQDDPGSKCTESPP